MLDRHPIPYDKLIDFAAGDLGETDSARIAEHIADCARCTATVTRYRKVSNVFFMDDTFEPPPATIARAQALFPRYRRSLKANSQSAFGWLSWRSVGFAYASLAVVLVIFVVGLLAVSGDAQPDSAFYPVRTAVQGLELRFSSALRNMGLPVPAGLPTAASSTPGTQGSPDGSPASPGILPPGQVNPTDKVPPGQDKKTVVPGQVNPNPTDKVPPGQEKKTVVPALVNPTPTDKVPPGQEKKTVVPAQVNPTPTANVPPGQQKKTVVPAPVNPPPQVTPTATSTPKAQGSPPSNSGNPPGKSGNSGNKK